MGRRNIELHRWYVKQNPKTGKTHVHLHGIEKKLLIRTRITENFELPYILNEPMGKSVRRAMNTSQNRWKIGIFTAMANGI